MRIIINGSDWSNKINPYTISLLYENVQGTNAGVSINGRNIFDTIRTKYGFSGVAGLLTQTEYNQLITWASQDVVGVEWESPQYGKSVFSEMEISVADTTQIPLNSGGYAYKNTAITMMEH